MTRADVREQQLLAADRPSRHLVIVSPVTTLCYPPPGPSCPRCGDAAIGGGGRWWCGECSAPVVVRL